MRAAASRCLAASCRTPAAGIRRNQNGASARRGAYGLRVARARRGSPVAGYAPRALVDLQRPTCVEFRPNSVNEIHSTPFANEKYIPHHSIMIKYRMSKIKYEKPFTRFGGHGRSLPARVKCREAQGNRRSPTTQWPNDRIIIGQRRVRHGVVPSIRISVDRDGFGCNRESGGHSDASVLTFTRAQG